MMQHKSKFYQIAPSHCNEKESEWTFWTCGMGSVEVHGSLDVNIGEKWGKELLNLTKNK